MSAFVSVQSVLIMNMSYFSLGETGAAVDGLPISRQAALVHTLGVPSLVQELVLQKFARAPSSTT